MVKRFLLALLACCCLVCPRLVAQSSLENADQIVDKISARERALVKDLGKYTPVAETYLQEFTRQGEEPEVVRDYYFLSLAKLGPKVDILAFRSTPRGKPVAHFVRSWLTAPLEYMPEGFAQMSHPNVDDLDRDHYRFTYVERQQLGDVDCLVFEVSPLQKSEGMYEGRIWVEERDYTIIRYKGGFLGASPSSGPRNDVRGHYLHFDTLRVKAGPGLWLPATVYTEETDYAYNWTPFGHLGHARLKAQTLFWSYDSSNTSRPEHQRRRADVRFQGTLQPLTSPGGLSEYPPERKAQDNVLAKLEEVGLLSPRGAADKPCESIASKLEVANDLHIRWAVECRELLTTRLEFLTVGHTIVISRGLMDVLPNEVSLAAVVALGLARIQLDIPIDKRYAYWDNLGFDPEDTFREMHFKTPSRFRNEVGNLAVQFLAKSPYRDSTALVHEFFAEAATKSVHLPDLFTANLGDSLLRYSDFFAKTRTHNELFVRQHRAKSLSGTKIDPWTDRLQAPEMISRDGQPFEVVPFVP